MKIDATEAHDYPPSDGVRRRGTPASGPDLPRDHTTGGAFQETRYGWSVLAAVWVFSGVYLGLQLHRGWVPFDAGQFGEMASRVLRGQVPSRDFGEVYTGGLTYLDALALRLFGVNFLSPRIMMFLFFLGWVPSVYLIARRFSRPIAAGAVTLLAVAWSVPNYPEAMPSWYNLFFATWGVLALLRYTETEKKRWLCVAGLCAGLSFLVKISGLYFVAAALLFFVFRELSLSQIDERRYPSGGVIYRLFASTGLVSFLAVLTALVSQRPLLINYVYFVLPSAALAAFLLWKTWQGTSDTSPRRLQRLFSMAAPFLGGALAPVAIFLLWYAHEGAVASWWQGVFVRSREHIMWVAGNPEPLVIVVGLAPLGIVFFAAGRRSAPARRFARLALPPALLALLVLASKVPLAYFLLGDSLPLLVPVLAFGAALWLLAEGRDSKLGTRQAVFLLAAVATSCALIQFPAPGPVYFDYVAPLVVLGLCSLLVVWRRCESTSIGPLLVFYLAFAVFLHAPGYFDAMRSAPDRTVELQRLNLPRAGHLLVEKSKAQEYEQLIGLVKSHARGPYIYCTPDCPEVYFLSHKRNPTRTIFEFMNRHFPDLAIDTNSILRTLRERGVTVVVLNFGRFVESGPAPAGLKAALGTRFPDSERVGSFQVRWRLGHTAGGRQPQANKVGGHGNSPASQEPAAPVLVRPRPPKMGRPGG